MDRNQSLDGLKYILICFVVIGHFIEPSRYSNNISGLLFSYIYTFHMPLFIWMNGYFFKKRDIKTEFIKCLPFLEICFLSHLGCRLIQNCGLPSIKDMLVFGTPAWYLICLVSWRLLTTLALRKMSVKTLFFISVFFELTTFLTCSKYGTLLSIIRTIQFYPFFLLGCLMKNKLDILDNKKILMYFGSLISIVFIYFSSSRFLHLVEFQRGGLMDLTPYTSLNPYSLFAFRYAVIISSLFISATILTLAKSSNILKRFANYGQQTLFIYYIHIFVYAIVIKIYPSFLMSLLFSFVYIILITILSKFPKIKWLMNPVFKYFKII